jgi:crossover junction endodeoxyribonuclease RuvC
MNSNKLIKTDKTYIGIDQSLTCTSVCVYTGQELTITRIKPDHTGVKRLNTIYEAVDSVLAYHPDAMVAIEGYAYNAKGMYFNLGEVGGAIRLAVFKRSMPLIQVPPTHLKKYITGVGNANKNVIIKELYKKYELDINDDNDADAASLAILCREYFETQFHIVTSLRTDLHKNCDLVIGDHPDRLTAQEYLKDAPPDMRIYEFEKMKKAKKKKDE